MERHREPESVLTVNRTCEKKAAQAGYFYVGRHHL